MRIFRYKICIITCVVAYIDSDYNRIEILTADITAAPESINL